MNRRLKRFYEDNPYGSKPIITFKYQVFNENHKLVKEKVLNIEMTNSYLKVVKAAEKVYRDFEKKVLAENPNHYTDLKTIQELYNNHIKPDLVI